jgi:hypothetical protein
MEPDEYLAEVDRFAEQMDHQHLGFELFISGLKGTSALAEACVKFRHGIATTAELADSAHYLELGFFADPDPERQSAWWLFLLDVNAAANRISYQRICEPYAPNQPLFVGAPNLFAHIRRRDGVGSPDFELIDDRAVQCVDRSEIYRAGPGFSKLAADLHPRIANWARDNFPVAPRFLRLDAEQFHLEQPLMALREAALVPANPKWMETLALFPNTKTFASYILEDCDPKAARARYIDYHLGGVRRLEVIAQRRKPEYLSMMIEELPRADESNHSMVGRCIHLDTRAVVGTPMAKARLQHLDLAINVYQGADRAARMAGSLQDGKVRDATCRTHLLRVEDVPFPAVFSFAEMFLKSRILLKEWTDALNVRPEA